MNQFSTPKKGEFPSYYESYIDKIPEANYDELIRAQLLEIRNLFASKPANWENISYAPGKWTPKEVLGHMIDTERIMTFRALCFARGEHQSLPGFNENDYVSAANFGEIALEDLLADFEAQRIALLSLIKTLKESDLDKVGKANEKPITPRALFWIIPGHFIHHIQVLNERY